MTLEQLTHYVNAAARQISHCQYRYRKLYEAEETLRHYLEDFPLTRLMDERNTIQQEVLELRQKAEKTVNEWFHNPLTGKIELSVEGQILVDKIWSCF